MRMTRWDAMDLPTALALLSVRRFATPLGSLQLCSVLPMAPDHC